MQSLRQASSRLATQRETHRFQLALQRRGASLVGQSQIGQALAKGLTWTGCIQAAKAPRMQAHTDGRLAQRKIGQYTREAAMRPVRAAVALWATRGPSGGGEVHGELVGGDSQRVQAQPGPLRHDGGKECGKTHGRILQQLEDGG